MAKCDGAERHSGQPHAGHKEQYTGDETPRRRRDDPANDDGAEAADQIAGAGHYAGTAAHQLRAAYIQHRHPAERVFAVDHRETDGQHGSREARAFGQGGDQKRGGRDAAYHDAHQRRRAHR